MFKRLFSMFGVTWAEDGDPPHRSGRAALRSTYDDWRFERDIAAVMAALDRLSNRQLHMIGLDRDSLFEAVEDMILDAAQQRALGREVLELLEASGTSAISASVDEAPSAEPARDVRAA